jgi:hypothetical protein
VRIQKDDSCGNLSDNSGWFPYHVITFRRRVQERKRVRDRIDEGRAVENIGKFKLVLVFSVVKCHDCSLCLYSYMG